MTFKQFLELVPKISNLPLPGRNAQFLMAPIERVKNLDEAEINAKNPKQAAVMALIYPNADQVATMALILRKTYKGVHSNQVGFAGGKVEPEDRDLAHTALRETEEEIGVAQDVITVTKALTNIYIPPSNFWVQCYLGYTPETPTFILEPSEVEALIEVPLADFLDDTAVIKKVLSTSYMENVEVPAFFLEGHVVWGATAMILSELKVLLQQA